MRDCNANPTADELGPTRRSQRILCEVAFNIEWHGHRDEAVHVCKLAQRQEVTMLCADVRAAVINANT